MDEQRPSLTAQEAADRLYMSLRQFERYVAAGRITPHRVGPRSRRLFVTAEVDALRAADPRT
jgi:excisionase family DNA binding protein